ncbi:Nucleolin Protein C23 [Triplophysa tibetana]|uniref:Nucleolin Protein C23 n=1 Tax=Triplophysa tibetana TaxID=1572043 RepID=A0A5A9NSN6_9TELE|nr:Nucleolin Protein C23 [Triplophysa tibetana]
MSDTENQMQVPQAENALPTPKEVDKESSDEDMFEEEALLTEETEDYDYFKKDVTDPHTLFIQNLPPSVKQDELKKVFDQATDIEMPIDNEGSTIGEFGYVEFASEEDQKKALELNGEKLRGQPLKLDRTSDEENFQEIQEPYARTLFIKNLPHSTKQDDLKEIFQEAIDIKLPLGKNGLAEGIAYIEFATEAIADKVFEEAQGSDVNGNSIVIGYMGEKSTAPLGDLAMFTLHQRKSYRKLDGKNVMGQPVKLDRASKEDLVGNKAANLPNKILVVNNLSYSVSVNTLRPIFEKAVAIRIPQKNGMLRGFGFVQFESAEDAKEALENCNNMEIEGRTVRIQFSKSKEERVGGGMRNFAAVQSSKTLFVKNLSLKATKDSLLCVFEKAVGIRISRKKGTSIGFGYVDFESVKDAEEALKTCNNALIEGKNIRLEFCQSREDKGAGMGNSAAFSSSKAVKNVPFSSTKDSTQNVPEKSVSIKIPLNIGNQKGCAFMEFTSVEDAIDALKTVNNAEIEGRSLTQFHKVFSQSEKKAAKLQEKKWTTVRSMEKKCLWTMPSPNVREVEAEVVPLAKEGLDLLTEEEEVLMAEVEEEEVLVAKAEEGVVLVAKAEDGVVLVAQVEDGVVLVAKAEDGVVLVAQVEEGVVLVAVEVEEAVA